MRKLEEGLEISFLKKEFCKIQESRIANGDPGGRKHWCRYLFLCSLLPKSHHSARNISQKIELNQKTNETLEEIAKTLFKSWFLDFDPVRAKAEGRPTGLSKEIGGKESPERKRVHAKSQLK